MKTSFLKKKLATLVLASLLLNLFGAFFTQNVNATSSTWGQYLDMDGNGTVDHAAIIFLTSTGADNNIGSTCTYNSSNWSVTDTGSINLLLHELTQAVVGLFVMEQAMYYI